MRLPKVTDGDIAAAMKDKAGGAFVRALGHAWIVGDPVNRSALRGVPAFQKYWEKYRPIAQKIKQEDPLA